MMALVLLTRISFVVVAVDLLTAPLLQLRDMRFCRSDELKHSAREGEVLYFGADVLIGTVILVVEVSVGRCFSRSALRYPKLFGGGGYFAVRGHANRIGTYSCALETQG